MKMRFSLFNMVLALSFLLMACGGDDDTPVSSVLPCISGAGSFTDSSGDAAFPFIDMTTLNVTVTPTDITADIDLVTIPTPLAYNDPSTPLNEKEYGWEVMFDVNGDGDCFSTGDIKMAVLHFKRTSSGPINNPLEVFTLHEVRKVESGGAETILGPITASVLGDKLTLKMTKSPILPTINSLTPVRFETTHISGGMTFKDHFPD